MTTVRDNPEKNRYEIHDGDQLAGFTDYELTDRVIAFTHTEVHPDFAGRGLARELVTAELDDARRRDLAVRPFCPYVLKVIAGAPEKYLVASEDRERFNLPADGDGDPS